MVHDSALDRDQLVIFASASHGHCSSGAFPLHLSSAGLLLLCGLPHSEALARWESHLCAPAQAIRQIRDNDRFFRLSSIPAVVLLVNTHAMECKMNP